MVEQQSVARLVNGAVTSFETGEWKCPGVMAEEKTTHHRAGSWNWQMKSQPVLWLTEEQPVSCLVDKVEQ